MLVDDGVLRRDEKRWELTRDLDLLAVPPTVSAVVAGRLERLAAPDLVVAERASVVGEVFYRPAVASLSPPEERSSLPERLDTLTRRDIVASQVSTFRGEDTFRFRHLLVRDAAYARLPKRERATLHEAFAGWLEDAAADRLLQFEEILGYHLETAYRLRRELAPVDEAGRQLGRRAAERLAAAGYRASDREDPVAAIKLLSRAAGVLPSADPERLRLLPDLGNLLGLNGEFLRAQAVLDECMDRAERTGDELVLARSRMALLHLEMRTAPEGWTAKAQLETASALPVFRRHKDASGVAQCYGALMFVGMNSNRWAEAAAANAQRLHYARLAGDRRVVCRSLYVQVLSGFYGPTPTRDGLELCRSSLGGLDGNPSMQAEVLEMQAALHAMGGQLDEAQRAMDDADLLRDHLPASQFTVIGPAEPRAWTYQWCGRPDEGERLLRQALAAHRQSGDMGYGSTVAAELARVVDARGGSHEEVEALLRFAEESGSDDDLSVQAPLRGTRARVLTRHGAGAAGEGMAREAVAITDRGTR